MHLTSPTPTIREIKRSRELRAFINALKARPCTDCTNKFPPIAMDFDHRDPDIKSAEISTLVGAGKPIEIILAEINKCDLVCANCHRVRTKKRYDDRKAANLPVCEPIFEEPSFIPSPPEPEPRASEAPQSQPGVESPYWITSEVLAYFRITRATLCRWRIGRGFPEPLHHRADRKDPAKYIVAECLAWDEARRQLR